jgi:cyanophycinase
MATRGCALAIVVLWATALWGAEPAGGIRGWLFIHGGGGVSDELRGKFLELAGGKAARIVVIPTASEWADSGEGEVRAWYCDPWKERGAADVQLLHTRSRERANAAEFVQPLRQATAVWFGGGDQSKIADAYLGTAVERELFALLARGGAIGGTSAGAAIQSRTMIAGGQDEPLMGVGFDFLPGAIIDQHFLARQRQARLRRAVADHPGHIGLGIDERTALLVQAGKMSVIGESTVSVFLSAREFEVPAGESLDWERLFPVARQPEPCRRSCEDRARPRAPRFLIRAIREIRGF